MGTRSRGGLEQERKFPPEDENQLRKKEETKGDKKKNPVVGTNEEEGEKQPKVDFGFSRQRAWR